MWVQTLAIVVALTWVTFKPFMIIVYGKREKSGNTLGGGNTLGETHGRKD
jgi:hypothetical protein